MSRHNYSQYSNNKNNINSQVEEQTPVVEVEETVTAPEAVIENPTPEITVVEETVTAPEVKMEVETVTGVVSNCTKLNVRAKPNATANVICVLDVASEVTIDVAKSNNDWFSVSTANGIEGYCMRKFVEASL